MIDLYCERLGPGLIAEPVNAISNLAFVIAAIFLFRLYRRNEKSVFTLLLVVLLATIAIGSTLFHTFATAWALQADVIPILLFQLMFLAAYAYKAMGMPWYWVGFLLFAFVLTGFGIQSLELPMNGSDGYLAPILFLLGLGIYHLLTAKSEPFLLLLCAAVFAVSLTLRTVDLSICEQFPLGTHFAWHLLNAIVLYLCGRACVLACSGRASGVQKEAH